MKRLLLKCLRFEACAARELFENLNFEPTLQNGINDLPSALCAL